MVMKQKQKDLNKNRAKNTGVVNNNVMYFNRGNITLLQAVLICDSGRLSSLTK